MLKRDFVNNYIISNLKENDKPFNRSLWNNTLDTLSKNGDININKAQYWTKEPKKYYGE